VNLHPALFALLVTTAPVAAAMGWGQYDDALFGFDGGIPSGFSGGEGDYHHAPSGSLLTYGAGPMAEPSFSAAVAASIAREAQTGWNLAFETVTPDWAGYTLHMGLQRRHVRMLLLCDRESVATMTLSYPARSAADLAPTIAELETQFTTGPC
jgi:hypothetical protein